jgi:hypothetical protein
MTPVRIAERITKYHPIGSEEFWSIWVNNFKIWNLYVKNIMFVCSLLTTTSTWHSNQRNGPGGYMSGELKSENIKWKKAPTQRSHYPAIRPTIIPHTTKSSERYSYLILDYFTILEKTLKTDKNIQPRLSLINKTLMDCCLYLNTISTNDLEYSLREAGEFKIITCYYSLTLRASPREVINSLH